MAETYEAADAVNVDLPDGEYSVEVNMTGGSGRASIRPDAARTGATEAAAVYSMAAIIIGVARISTCPLPALPELIFIHLLLFFYEDI